MPRNSAKQLNPYRGIPPRAWLRLGLGNDAAQELLVIADTGNPCALIVGLDVLNAFRLEEAGDVESNFGLLQGGWLDVAVPDLGFCVHVLAYESEQVAAAARHSDSRFAGLAGLPLLRKLEYGGDAEGFWVKRP